MDILSKKHKPIKTYRSHGKRERILCFIGGIFIISLTIFLKETAMTILFFIFFLWWSWLYNTEFEIYNDRFVLVYSFVLLPCKLVVTDVFFDEIDRMDSRVIDRTRSYRMYTIIIHCKNGAIKECEFKGSVRDFNDVLNNWKEIANYENKQ